MAQQLINIGTANNAGDGEGLRPAFDKTNDNFTELYGVTGWESRFNAATQTLTASDNLITITGVSLSNGGLTFLDTNGKVVPLQENDMISVDFGCTAVTPSGSDNYLHLKFVVNTVVFRAVTVPLLKGSGNDNEISLSANLPVGSDFNTYGMEVYIEPNVGLDINNKYISVVRTHKAK